MKPLLITASSYTKNAERFIKSIIPLYDDINYLSIEFTPYYPAEIGGGKWIERFELGMRVKYMNRPYPGNIGRFLAIKDIIYKFKYDTNPGQWVIFSDTDDVIFQTKLPEFEAGKQIYSCSEGVTFGDSSFWKPILKKYVSARPLTEKIIHNAGCFAMRMRYFMSFLDFVDKYSKTNRATKKEGTFDQIMYNLWLNEQPPLIRGVHSYFMGCLYDGLNNGTIIKGEDKKGNRVFTNSEKIPYCLIHGNGSTKKHL